MTACGLPGDEVPGYGGQCFCESDAMDVAAICEVAASGYLICRRYVVTGSGIGSG